MELDLQPKPRDDADASAELDPRWHGAMIPSEHWHFHRQLLERYKIVLAPGEFTLIHKALKAGTAQLIERRKGRKAIYSVKVPSVMERVYILARGPVIITAWPPEKRLNAIRRSLKRDHSAGLTTDSLGPQAAE